MRLRALCLSLLALPVAAVAAPMSRLLDGPDVVEARCALPTSAGGYFLAGIAGTDFVTEAWWAEVDAQGLPLRQGIVAGSGRERIADCAASPLGGWVLAGSTTTTPGGDEDGWVLRLDASGNVVWQRSAGLDEDDAFDGVVMLGDGSFVTAGVHARIGANGRERHAWTARWSDAGVIAWSRIWPGAGDARFEDVTVLAGGAIVAVGTERVGPVPKPLAIRHDAAGALLGLTILDAPDASARRVAALRDGGFVVAGTQTMPAGSDDRAWVTRFADTGMVAWQAAVGGGDGFAIGGVAEAVDGTIAVAGGVDEPLSGNPDACMHLLDASGRLLGIRRVGDLNPDEFLWLQALPGGDWLLSGKTLLQETDGTGQAWLLRADPEGRDDGCMEAGPSGLAAVAWSASEAAGGRSGEDPAVLVAPALPVEQPGALVGLDLCPSCRLVEWRAMTPQRTCLGAPVTLDSSSLELLHCAAGETRAWTDPAGAPAGTGPSVIVTPDRSGDYDVRLDCISEPGCWGSRVVAVDVDGEPALGAFAASDVLPCNSGIAISWEAALFRSRSGSGSYSLHRSTIDCADALAQPPIAADIGTTAWFDAAAPVGVPVHYALVAEDSVATSCGEAGPLRGGAVARSCAAVTMDVATTNPPADAGAVLRMRREGIDLVVAWPGLRALGAGEHVHVLRLDDPPAGAFLQANGESDTGAQTLLPPGAVAVSWFDARIANACETLSLD